MLTPTDELRWVPSANVAVAVTVYGPAEGNVTVVEGPVDGLGEPPPETDHWMLCKPAPVVVDAE